MKEIKLDKLHYYFLILLVVMIVINMIEVFDIFEKDLTNEELIQQGRDLELMKLYSPCELLYAVENQEYDYNELSDNIQGLLSVVDDC